jgi:UDP-N-acetylglucosamine acyltransferase
MAKIHPSALVSPKAELASDVVVGSHCVVEDHVRIDAGTTLLSGVVIAEWTDVGKNNRIHMGAVIGHEPQDLSWKGGKSFVKIGDNNTIREYVTIHRGTKEDTATLIGNDNYLMGLSHVAHNCKLGNGVILCNGALLAGYVEVEDKAFISGNVVVHQYVKIGKLSMMSGGGATSKDVPPFMIVAGRSEVYGVNLVGMRRAGFSREAIYAIKDAYHILFKSGLATKNALVELESKAGSGELRYLLNFIKTAPNGICRPRVEERGKFASPLTGS